MGYLILWLQWQGASEAPLDIKEGVIFLTPSHVAKDYLLLGTFGDHMQKFGPKSQKLNEILGFQNFMKMRFSYQC